MNFLGNLKKITAAVLLLAGGFVSAQNKTITLEDYISLVEKNNKDLLLAEKNTESAWQTVNMARSALLPMVGVSAGYTRNMYELMQETVVGAYNTGSTSQIFPGYTQDVRQNYDNEISVGLGVTQSIYNPQSVGNFRLASKNHDIQKEVEQFTKDTLIMNAKKLYSQVQLLESVAIVREEAAETAESVFKNQERKFNNGTITELDMRMAEVDYKNSKTSLAAARKNVRLAMMALKTFAGIPQSQEIALEENPAETETKDIETQIDFEDALSRRADYQALALAYDAARIKKQNSLAAYLPSVDASFTLGYVQYGGYEGQDDWNAYSATPVSLGIKIQLPLLTGGYRLAATKDSDIQIEKAQLEMDKKRNEIEQEFESAKLRIAEAKLQMEEAASAEETASRALTLAKKSLESGLGTMLAVSQSETQHALARLNLQNAVYEYKSACYDFEYVAGM